MISISLCMIVKNEEDVLARCLDSVKGIVDEIIIIDTGSTDKTVEIAEEYTDKVYSFTWINDFSAARNYSFSKATKEYTMWLDADDILLEKDQKALLNLKNQLDSSVDIVMMKYNVAFDANGNPTMTYHRERILRSDKNYQWLSPIHEVITPRGNIIYSDIAITHRKEHPTNADRNINIFEEMISKDIVLDPRQQFYYARELYYHARYQEAIETFSTFLEEGKGWIENNIDACKTMAICYNALKQPEMALSSLLKSLELDAPRAEICCELGKHFFNCKQYKTAIFWYITASTRDEKDKSGGFSSPDCYGFIPYIQLCVCYDKIGETKLAKKYHYKSKHLKPGHPSVHFNEEYFKSR